MTTGQHLDAAERCGGMCRVFLGLAEAEGVEGVEAAEGAAAWARLAAHHWARFRGWRGLLQP